MRVAGAIIAASFAGVTAMVAATQTLAAMFAYQPALGAPIVRTSSGEALYWPWSIIFWSSRWSETFPRPFALAHLVLVGVGGIGFVVVAVAANGGAPRLRRHGPSGWA